MWISLRIKMAAATKIFALIISVFICSALATTNQGYGMLTSQDDKNYAVCPSYTIDCTIQDVCCPIGTYCFGGTFQGICCPTSKFLFSTFHFHLVGSPKEMHSSFWILLTNETQTRTAQPPWSQSRLAQTPLGNYTMRATPQPPRSE